MQTKKGSGKVLIEISGSTKYVSQTHTSGSIEREQTTSGCVHFIVKDEMKHNLCRCKEGGEKGHEVEPV